MDANDWIVTRDTYCKTMLNRNSLQQDSSRASDTTVSSNEANDDIPIEQINNENKRMSDEDSQDNYLNPSTMQKPISNVPEESYDDIDKPSPVPLPPMIAPPRPPKHNDKDNTGIYDDTDDAKIIFNDEESGNFYDDCNDTNTILTAPQIKLNQKMPSKANNNPQIENYFLCLYDTISVKSDFMLKLKRGEVVEFIENVSKIFFIGKFQQKLGLVCYKNAVRIYECITSDN